jgi:hypothetical protein
MRKLTEMIYRLRWGALQKRRERGLIHLHDLLAQTPLAGKYWIVLGLLLGCIRDGEPMRWDTDADFGFLEEHLDEFLAAVRVLESKGFRLRPVPVNNDGTMTKWALKYQGVKYEFYLFRRINGKLRWYYHSRNPALEVVNEVDAHELDEIELYGRRWLKPANHEDYLKSLYGDWRTPDPHYRYWRDCQASVARHPWTGRRTKVMN